MAKSLSNKNLQIQFTIPAASTAEAFFVFPDKKVLFTFNSISHPDPLTSLLKAVVNIHDPQKQFWEIDFTGEPQQYKLQVTRMSKTQSQLLLFYIPSWVPVNKLSFKKTKPGKVSPLPLPSINEYSLLGSCQCSITQLQSALYNAVEQLSQQVPKNKYKQTWGYPFPVAVFHKLKEQINS